jgi:prepilin-type N-terminal cleavage/methylation domain-containing protein
VELSKVKLSKEQEPMERGHNRTSGFTLIEILVVVSIIGVLAGMVGVIIAKANQKALRTATITLVKTTLNTKIKMYEQEMGRYPASNLGSLRKQGRKVKPWKEVSMSDGNEVNSCNEILILQLRHPDFSKKLVDDDLQSIDQPFGNIDDDSFTGKPVGAQSEAARELLDAWGSPIVYIYNADYGKSIIIRNKDGDDIEVMARKREDGTYYNENTFQLISLGPDGLQDESAVGDDIMNFKVEGS